MQPPGKHHWTPGEQVADIADSEFDSVDSPGLQPFIEPYRPVVDSPPHSPTVQLDEAEQGSKQKKGVVQVGSQRRSLAAHQCLQTVSTISWQWFVHRSTSRSDRELVHLRSMALRHACKGLWLYPLYQYAHFFHFACIALENADYCEILMYIPDDGNVVGWLTALKASKGL